MGKPVAVDIHNYDEVSPHHAESIEAADFLFMSSLLLAEWRHFLEERIASGTKAAVCTPRALGASGLTADTGWIDIPAVAVENVVDTNGAGDAFYASFMTLWLSGGDLETAMHGDAAAAAAAVQSPDLAPRQ